jgi:hypothetical protein
VEIMLRTRNPGTLGRNRVTHRTLAILAGGLLAFAAGAAAEGSSMQWGPYRGDEPLPGALAGADAPTAIWDHRIVGSSLKPRQNDVNYAWGSDGGCAYVTSGDASTVWNTPFIAPQGATVRYLRVYVNDTNASDVTGWFTVYDLFGAMVQEWGISSSGTPGQAWFDTAAINHVIDYSLYSYVLNMRPNGTGSTLQFCGARLFFDPPEQIFRNGFES